ncbi:MAG: BLUF domain-containing protein [Pseudomonadota bacterium]
MSEMGYMVYVSQASRPMQEADLADILTKSRAYNTEDGVTGLLIYRYLPETGRGNFMQLLEGPKDKVDAAWGRIAADDRHHTQIVLEEGPIAGRACPNWSMGFRNVETRDLADKEGFADLGEDSFSERALCGQVHGARDLMSAFYEADD